MFDPSNRLFDLAGRLPGDAETVGLMPAVEIAESDTEFTCTAELPGLTEKNVEVSFADGELRIKGEKKEEKESKTNGKRYHILERSYGSFERSFTFPGDVDPAKIVAEFKNGVLTVRLPKTTDGKRVARTIPVSTK
jgi:HSP20 family protein